MSSNKYTSRGFGASGASQSTWNAPRDSYKAPRDQGTNFLFGGAGLRGSPKSGAQHRATPSGAGAGASPWTPRIGEARDSDALSAEQSKDARGIDLSGGDTTTSKLERTILFVGVVVVALVCSVLFRACAGGSDSGWIQEHRAHINSEE